MGIKIRNAREIGKIKKSGTYVYKILHEIKDYIEPGKSTYDINTFAKDLFEKYDVFPTFLGFEGFPGNVCISINEEIVHGTPQRRKKVKEGDLISIDCGVTLNGYIGDSCISFILGEQKDPKYQKLLDLSRQATQVGIDQCKPGNRILDIGKAIEEFCNENDVTSIRRFTGHGVGTKLHEPPRVFHYVPDKSEKVLNPLMKKGMVFTVEPMITYCKDPGFVIKEDGWTAVTMDGSICSQFEHTLAITEDGYEILTGGE